MSAAKLPKNVIVPTSLGEAVGTPQGSDLNGGYIWQLCHPWGELTFSGTSPEAKARLKRLVKALDTEDNA